MSRLKPSFTFRVLSFSESSFTYSEKKCFIGFPPQKAGLGHEDMSNSCPFSNLLFLSKLIERAILDQLVKFLDENNNIDTVESAYSNYHSVETALCKIKQRFRSVCVC